jgi:hypothetical protein
LLFDYAHSLTSFNAKQTWAIVVQSTEVVQSKFVPINATCLMLLNAVTGIIIWEDWRVIASWVGYVCVFLLLALASFLLLSSAPLMTSENPEYGQRAHFRAKMIRSNATRTLNPLDLGPMSESTRIRLDKDGSGDDQSDQDERSMSNQSGNEKDENENGSTAASQQSNGDNDHDANGIKTDRDDIGGNEDNGDVSRSTHPNELDDESQTNNDVEAPPSPRPRIERALTRREAWQSVYHLHFPDRSRTV